MITVIKTFGRLTILLSLTALILGLTVAAEIFIDRLTFQSRDLQHLLKHSLGNIGALMVALSIAGYMLKKKFKSFPGKAKDWLDVHQSFSIAGVILIGVHTGAHFRAVIPVICLLMLFVALVSGLIGRHIYLKTKSELKDRRAQLIKSGMSADDADEKLALAAAAAKALSKWREVHRPISISMAALLVWHVVSALFYGG